MRIIWWRLLLSVSVSWILVQTSNWSLGLVISWRSLINIFICISIFLLDTLDHTDNNGHWNSATDQSQYNVKDKKPNSQSSGARSGTDSVSSAWRKSPRDREIGPAVGATKVIRTTSRLTIFVACHTNSVSSNWGHSIFIKTEVFLRSGAVTLGTALVVLTSRVSSTSTITLDTNCGFVSFLSWIFVSEEFSIWAFVLSEDRAWKHEC